MVLALEACSARPADPDAGTPDAGLPDAGALDAGPLQDAGQFVGTGCISPLRQKFIARLVSTTVGTCVELAFHISDGGAQLLFPETVIPPDGFSLSDARYWPCSLGSMEQADGGLHPAAPVVEGLWGHFEFEFVDQGRPFTYRVDGGALIVGSRAFTITRQVFGCGQDCKAE